MVVALAFGVKKVVLIDCCCCCCCFGGGYIVDVRILVVLVEIVFIRV